MASEAMKQMFMKRLFNNQLAKQAASKMGDIVGAPEQPVLSPYGQPEQVNVPDPSAPFGLMTMEADITPATGLFEEGLTDREKFLRASGQMVESGSPMLQEKGLDMLSSMQTNLMGGAAGMPASIQEWNVFRDLPPAKQQEYLNMKRGGYKIVDIEGVPTRVPLNYVEGAGAAPEALTTLEAEAAGQARIERQKTQAKVGETGIVQRHNTNITEGMLAADGYSNIKRGLQLLGDVETGGIDKVSLMAKQFFGVEGANEAELSNRLGKAVLSQLRATFGAAFTAKEGEQLKEIEAGFGKSTEGNKRLLVQAEKLVRRVAERGIRSAEYVGDFETADEIRRSLEFRLGNGDQSSAQKTSPSGITYTVK